MKNINKVAYQVDVVSTLVDNPKKDYILWVDAWDRLIETQDGVNKQITDHYAIVKICKLFNYPIEGITTNTK